MFKIITLPFDRIRKGFDEDLLNKFLLNKQIKGYKAELFKDCDGVYWTIFLEYDPMLEKTSEHEVEGLDKPQKILFDHLKAWRKERAEKDGVPVYIIGTNKELVSIVKTAPKSLEALKQIKGFGKAKIERYGKEIIDNINGFFSKS